MDGRGKRAVPKSRVCRSARAVVPQPGHPLAPVAQIHRVFGEQPQVMAAFALAARHAGVGAAGAVLVGKPVRADNDVIGVRPVQLGAGLAVTCDAVGVAACHQTAKLPPHDDVLVALPGFQRDFAHDGRDAHDFGLAAKGIPVDFAGIQLQAGKFGFAAVGVAEQLETQVGRGRDGQIERSALALIPGTNLVAAAILIIVAPAGGQDGAQRGDRIAG